MAKKKPTDTEPSLRNPAEENDRDAGDVTPEQPESEGAADDQAPAPDDRLQEELVTAQAEAARNWDLYLRERADLENFRKRTQRDKDEAIRYANDRLLKEMIPVLDNLERAVEHANQSDGPNQGLLEGVNMTITLFHKVLTDFGVKPVVAVGAAFDPNLHQAMGQIETDEQPPNTVVSEFQKGYLLNDRLLRPSLVMVAKPTPQAKGDAPEDTDETDSQADA